jgi:hypothetical protein
VGVSQDRRLNRQARRAGQQHWISAIVAAYSDPLLNTADGDEEACSMRWAELCAWTGLRQTQRRKTAIHRMRLMTGSAVWLKSGSFTAESLREEV